MAQSFTICCLVLSLCLIGCGSTSTLSSSPDNQSSSGSTTDTVVGGNVSALSIDSSGTIDLSSTTADDVMVMLYNFNESSSSYSYELGSSTNDSLFVSQFLEDDLDNLDQSEEFHEIIRSFEDELDPDDALDEADTRYLIKTATVGSTETFNVLSSLSNSSTGASVTAELRVQNDDISLYVDVRDESTLSNADLEELLNKFSSVIDDERNLFGNESDVNGDGRVSVLFTREVNKLGGSSGGMITGFFYAVDLFTKSKYSISNEREIFYTYVPDSSGEHGSAVSKSFSLQNIYPGVMVHEFQHMISFNQHYFLHGGSSETGWVNEALSHLAEDIYSINSNNYMEETGLENFARVARFQSSIDNTCFTCGTSLKQRGGSYLFLRYLYEQAEIGNLEGAISGEDLIENLLSTSLRGIENVINASFGSSGSEADFKKVLGMFGLALYISNTDTNTDTRLNFKGINLRALQDDNRGTQLQGPSIQEVTSFPFTDSVSGNGIHFLQISRDTLDSVGGKVNYNLANGSSFGGYVIQ